MSQGNNSRRGGIGGESDLAEPIEPVEQVSEPDLVPALALALDELQQRLTQTEGQLPEHRSAILEHRNALLAMQQQMNTIHQKVILPNLRTAALEFAARIKGPADDARKVAAAAEIFYEFLIREPSEPATSEAQSELPNGRDPEEGKLH